MYIKGNKGLNKHLDFIMLDILAITLSYFLIYQKIDVIFISIVATLTTTFVDNNFKNILKRNKKQDNLSSIKHCILVFISMHIFLILINEKKEIIYELYAIMLYFTLNFLFKNILRLFLKRKNKKKIIILTTTNEAENVVENISINIFDDIDIVGLILLDNNNTEIKINNIDVVSTIENATNYICHTYVDEILIYIPKYIEFPIKLYQTLIEMGLTVHINLLMSEDKNIKTDINKLGNYSVLTKSLNMTTIKQNFEKRCLDLLISLIGCIITLILFIIFAPLIYIQSPGPILFIQERIGKNGKRFKLYKFRSMCINAEYEKEKLLKDNIINNNLMFKIKNDPRIIGGKNGIGSFIRKYSIDEFPQFFNVLKGDMSIVGTRPPTVSEWILYEPHHRIRLSIKPGITGLWQVSGRSEITNFEDVLNLDIQYINNYNIKEDLKIIFKTIVIILKGNDAY